MDENYLDNLLNEISLDNEIDEEMDRPQHGRKIDLKADTFDHMVSQDSDTGLSSADDISGELEFDELDELDRMADMDMADMDFDDLDFDDLDMLDTTPKQESQVKHSAVTEQKPSLQEDVPEINLDDLSIDDMFFEQPQEKENTGDEASSGGVGADDFLSNFASFEDSLDEAQSNQTPSPIDETGTPPVTDLDSLSSGEETADINDLLEMLGIEDDEPKPDGEVPDALTQEQEADAFSDDLNGFLDESLSEVDDIADSKPKHPLLQFLFGPDEEEEPELSEEELLAIKAEKQAKKDAKKAEKQAKAEEKKAAKSAKDAAANADKAAKKALKAAKKKEEADSEPPEKKLNKKAVMVVMAFFAVVAAIIILGTNTFNYKLVIQKATNYFERQKYHMAYDEIAGVEVKKEDQELEDKIYTVMYVERLYESYETNAKLGRMNKALDSLLRGLTKYDEHYAEAEELNIVADINYSRDKIVAALLSTYGLTIDDAYDILALDSYEYRARLEQYATNQGDASVIIDNTTQESEPDSDEAQQ